MQAPHAPRDPVCGIRVPPDRADFWTLHDGRVYSFCSRACQTVFEAFPEDYHGAPAESDPAPPLGRDDGSG